MWSLAIYFGVHEENVLDNSKVGFTIKNCKAGADTEEVDSVTSRSAALYIACTTSLLMPLSLSIDQTGKN